MSLSRGDAVRIRTWGRASSGDRTGIGPRGSGRRTGGCTFVVTDAAVAAHSVVGNVAPAITFDGRGFFVGPEWKGRTPIPGTTAAEGRLLLGFNDDGMMCDRGGYDSWEFSGTNSGSFTAEISITRAR